MNDYTQLITLAIQLGIIFGSIWTLLLTGIFVSQFRPGGKS